MPITDKQLEIMQNALTPEQFEKFKASVDPDYFENATNPARILAEAFIWADTLEGHAYWEKLESELWLGENSEGEQEDSYVDQLFEFLQENKLVIGDVTLGSNPGSREDLAKELLESLQRLVNGEMEVVSLGEG